LISIREESLSSQKRNLTMYVSMDISISGSKEEVWKTITDIRSTPEIIEGIEKVEILNDPAEGLVGLKWRQTRTMLGQETAETIWVTEAAPQEVIQTASESRGTVYVTNTSLAAEEDGTRLTMDFQGTPQTLIARVITVITSPLIKNTTRKSMEKELMDIKAAVESKR